MASTPATYLATVNRVLARMREQQVGSLPSGSEYVTLIQNLVKESVEEVESAWQWNALNTTVPLTLVGGTSTYSLEDLGDSFIIDSVWNDTKNYPIHYPVTSSYINSQFGSTTTSSPSSCGIYGVDANGDPQLRFYPTPTDADSVTVYVKRRSIYTGQGEDVILCPVAPVYMGAIWRAVSERGDDGGAVLDEMYMQYQKTLGDYISMDAGLGHTQTDWVAD